VFRDDLETLVVSGPDRLEWLEAVLTCDVAGVTRESGRWSLALTKPGKIVADLLLVETGAVAYLGVPSQVRERLQGFLAGFLVMEDADIAWSQDFLWATAHGPLAFEWASGAAGEARGHAASLALTGLGDAALVYPRDAGDAVRRAAAENASGVAVASAEDWERLRVERGVPLYGKDFSDATSPHEASLERRCISWEKGCYLGQEAVCMQEMRGKVKRRTVLLRVQGPVVPEPGTKVHDAAGALVGETRTASRSAVHGHPLALAVVSAALAVPGASLRIGDQAAAVVDPIL
jgi:folate-binding protein YgfZ